MTDGNWNGSGGWMPPEGNPRKVTETETGRERKDQRQIREGEFAIEKPGFLQKDYQKSIEQEKKSEPDSQAGRPHFYGGDSRPQYGTIDEKDKRISTGEQRKTDNMEQIPGEKRRLKTSEELGNLFGTIKQEAPEAAPSENHRPVPELKPEAPTAAVKDALNLKKETSAPAFKESASRKEEIPTPVFKETPNLNEETPTPAFTEVSNFKEELPTPVFEEAPNLKEGAPTPAFTEASGLKENMPPSAFKEASSSKEKAVEPEFKKAFGDVTKPVAKDTPKPEKAPEFKQEASAHSFQAFKETSGPKEVSGLGQEISFSASTTEEEEPAETLSRFGADSFRFESAFGSKEAEIPPLDSVDTDESSGWLSDSGLSVEIEESLESFEEQKLDKKYGGSRQPADNWFTADGALGDRIGHGTDSAGGSGPEADSLGIDTTEKSKKERIDRKADSIRSQDGNTEAGKLEKQMKHEYESENDSLRQNFEEREHQEPLLQKTGMNAGQHSLAGRGGSETQQDPLPKKTIGLNVGQSPVAGPGRLDKDQTADLQKVMEADTSQASVREQHETEAPWESVLQKGPDLDGLQAAASKQDADRAEISDSQAFGSQKGIASATGSSAAPKRDREESRRDPDSRQRAGVDHSQVPAPGSPESAADEVRIPQQNEAGRQQQNPPSRRERRNRHKSQNTRQNAEFGEAHTHEGGAPQPSAIGKKEEPDGQQLSEQQQTTPDTQEKPVQKQSEKGGKQPWNAQQIAEFGGQAVSPSVKPEKPRNQQASVQQQVAGVERGKKEANSQNRQPVPPKQEPAEKPLSTVPQGKPSVLEDQAAVRPETGNRQPEVPKQVMDSGNLQTQMSARQARMAASLDTDSRKAANDKQPVGAQQTGSPNPEPGKNIDLNVAQSGNQQSSNRQNPGQNQQSSNRQNPGQNRQNTDQQSLNKDQQDTGQVRQDSNRNQQNPGQNRQETAAGMPPGNPFNQNQFGQNNQSQTSGPGPVSGPGMDAGAAYSYYPGAGAGNRPPAPPNYGSSYNYNYGPGYGFGGPGGPGGPGSMAMGRPPKKSRGIWILVGVLVGFLILIIIGVAACSDSSDYYSYAPNYDYIATVYVEGTIASSNTSSFGYPVGYQHNWTLNQIDYLMRDSNNKAIILYVDSPGGGVFESDELYLKIKEYKERTSRPVYAYMGSMAASGGYYVSAPADKIYANRNTWTGSVGVTMGTFFDISEFLERYGVKTQTITSGANKAMGSSVEPMTEQQRAIFQSLIDDAYDQFVGIVAEERGLTIQQARNIADGRIYTAKQALDLDLIDEIGWFDECLDDMRDAYRLQDAEVIDVYYEVRGSLFWNILGDVDLSHLSTGGEAGSILSLVEERSKYPISYLCEWLQ